MNEKKKLQIKYKNSGDPTPIEKYTNITEISSCSNASITHIIKRKSKQIIERNQSLLSSTFINRCGLSCKI